MNTLYKEYEEKTTLQGRGPEGEAVSRLGSVTPTEKFNTFPLAKDGLRQPVTDERIPSEDSVTFVKEFADENEK